MCLLSADVHTSISLVLYQWHNRTAAGSVLNNLSRTPCQNILPPAQFFCEPGCAVRTRIAIFVSFFSVVDRAFVVAGFVAGVGLRSVNKCDWSSSTCGKIICIRTSGTGENTGGRAPRVPK